jgi:hypothetical protein
MLIICYFRSSPCTKVNECRKYLFTRKDRQLENIPPTEDALYQHTLRAVYQGVHVWGQALVCDQNLPSPSAWGWKQDAGQWIPHWSDKPAVASICLDLTRCKCKAGRKTRCNCMKRHLKCIPSYVSVEETAMSLEMLSLIVRNIVHFSAHWVFEKGVLEWLTFTVTLFSTNATLREVRKGQSSKVPFLIEATFVTGLLHYLWTDWYNYFFIWKYMFPDSFYWYQNSVPMIHAGLKELLKYIGDVNSDL